jgi:hypothetical protein
MAIGDDADDFFKQAIEKEEPEEENSEGDRQEQDSETEQPEEQEAETEAGEVEAEAEGDEGGDRQRDPATGKFLRKEKPEERQDHRIPLAEHLSEREKRQNAERERDELRRQLEAARPRPQPRVEEEIDPWTDLPTALKKQRQEFQDTLEQFRIDQSLELARVRHGEVFDKAFAEIKTAAEKDPALNQRIFASRNIGEAIVGWYKEQTALKEIGPDPVAYKQRLREDLLKDPEFLKAAIAAAEKLEQPDEETGETEPRTRSVIKLPPSLNKQPGSGGNSDKAPAEDQATIFRGMFAR